MTTTYVQFTPSTTSSPPFQFTATMSGVDYTVTTTWNVYGQRWYINVYDSDGTRLKTQPLIASPLSGDILLAPVLFGSNGTLVYREASNNFEIS